ncbi:MAG: polysaccharide deacetylase family protein [Propionibacteriales bacterium]|nr:polysaccharide deacetylase family protein [Propionibacteriales bacterium]
MARSRSLWLAAGALLLTGMPVATPAAATQAERPAGADGASRCGAPSGVTYLTYDDANYKRPYAAVRLASAARRLHVGLGIFHVSSVTRRYFASTGISIPQRLRSRGMYVNNHTYDHPHLTRLSVARIDWEIKNGIKGGWLRPPYGDSNRTVASRAHALDYRICMWTFDTWDWKGFSGSSICSDVVHNAPRGAVVLMHLNHSAANPQTLQCIVHGLRQRGHTICRPYTSTHPGKATPVRLYRLPC